jgi:hypothetical protein
MRAESPIAGIAVQFVAALAALTLALAPSGSVEARQGLSCSSFHSQADAQAVYDANIRNGLGDRFDLDTDGDGVACEGTEDAEARDGDPPAADDEPGPSPSPVARGTYSFPDPDDADIDRFWQRAFADAGIAYDPPDGLLPVGPAAFRGLCIGGRLNPGETTAFYCLADRTIYYDRDVRAWIDDEYGPMAWTFVMAHEWGHHVQLLLDPLSRFDAGGPHIELQADCLAGVYLADAVARGWIDPTELERTWPFVLDSGSPDTHGSGTERAEAYRLGLDGGAPACNVSL